MAPEKRPRQTDTTSMQGREAPPWPLKCLCGRASPREPTGSEEAAVRLTFFRAQLAFSDGFVQ